MSTPNAAASDPAAQQPIAIDKRKALILGGIGLVVIVLIFWKVIPQIGSYSDAVNALQSMGALAFALVALSVVVYLLAYGLPFRAAIRTLPFWRSEQVNQAAFAISNGVPAGGAVGLAVQYGMLASYGVPATSATAGITAVGIWSTFISLGFPILGVAAFAASGGTGEYTGLAFLGLGILVVVVVGFVLIMRSERLARGIGRLGNRLVNPLRGRIAKLRDVDLEGPLVHFRASMYDVLRERWIHLTVAQVLVAVTQFLVLYVALRGVQGWDQPGASVLAAFAAFGISQIMLMVPITPGGLGTVDALMISILVSTGVAKGDATAADLVWRAVSYVPQIVIGIVALLAWTRAAGRKFASA